jgi:hypothetical protein
MTKITVKNALKKDLRNYKLNATNSLHLNPKVTIKTLPPFVPIPSSTNSTEKSENISTDYNQFIKEVLTRLDYTNSRGQKNRLYKITLLVGNFDESEIPLLENAPFIVTGTPLLSTEKLIAGGVIRVTAGLT